MARLEKQSQCAPDIFMTSTKRPRVLCVEDDKDMCELITMLLADCEVSSAPSVVEALHKASNEEFDLILLDYHLPDGTGLQVCRSIRAFNNKTPILFVTGTKSMSALQVKTAGAQGLVKKGPDFAETLASAVEPFMKSPRRRGAQ
jgi:CheY-like chemotaxis protein